MSSTMKIELRDDSSRTNILYALFNEFIEPMNNILDIGCGFTPLFLGTAIAKKLYKEHGNTVYYYGIDIRSKIIEHCKNSISTYNWICGNAAEYEIDKKYDIVIHVGFDKWWSDAWKIHQNLLNSKSAPKYVLLESGCPLNQETGEHLEVYHRIRQLYLDSKYEYVQMGTYLWQLPGINGNKRVFCILEDKE